MPSECKGGPVYNCQPACHSKENMIKYIGNGMDYGGENLEWLDVRRADGIYLRDGGVDPTNKPDGMWHNT